MQAAADRLADAVRSGNTAEVNRLLSQGVDPNAPNQSQTPPLVTAAERGPNGLTIVRALLDHDADPNAHGPGFDTPLIAAIDAYVGEDEAPGIVEVLRLLMDRGAKQDVGPRSPLSAALLRPGRSLAAKFLIERGASLDVGDGYTSLHAVAYANLVDRVRAQLRAGADPNARDRSHRTPLLLAADGGSVETIEALLESGADVNARTPRGESALLTALTHKRIAAARLLAARGADVNSIGEKGKSPLIMALRISQWPPFQDRAGVDILIGELLERGADVNAVSRSREIPLLLAVADERSWEPGRKGWVTALLERGADPNARSEYYGPPLTEAVYQRRKSLEIPQLLIAHGADVNRSGAGGVTPLMSAVSAQDYGFAKLLIDSGARVDCTDEARKTPLHWAAFRGEMVIVRALLDHGAAVNAEDVLNQTPLALAVKANRTEIAALLRSRGGTARESPAPARNGLGQPVSRLPVELVNHPPGPVSFALTAVVEAPKLLIRRGRVLAAKPVSLSSLLTSRDLWTPREVNDNLANVQSGYFSASAYRSFGFVSVNGQAYLGLLWYAPAASDQHQIIQFVFRCRVVDSRLELTAVWKDVPEYSTQHYFGGRLPRLAVVDGRLTLTDTNGVFTYQADARWKKAARPAGR